MGTRSITFVQEDDGTKLVAMYRQMDGYPTGMGADIKEFLNGASLYNDISLTQDNGNVHNDMGCLAASLVAHFKTDIGGIYLHPTDCGSDYISYTYTIYTIGEAGDIYIKVKHNYSGDVLYDGLLSDFDPESCESD